MGGGVVGGGSDTGDPPRVPRGEGVECPQGSPWWGGGGYWGPRGVWRGPGGMGGSPGGLEGVPGR